MLQVRENDISLRSLVWPHCAFEHLTGNIGCGVHITNTVSALPYNRNPLEHWLLTESNGTPRGSQSAWDVFF